jgi:hypothetical protein
MNPTPEPKIKADIIKSNLTEQIITRTGGQTLIPSHSGTSNHPSRRMSADAGVLISRA